MEPDNYETWTKDELHDELVKRNEILEAADRPALALSGNKDDLIAELRADDATELGEPATGVDQEAEDAARQAASEAAQAERASPTPEPEAAHEATEEEAAADLARQRASELAQAERAGGDAADELRTKWGDPAAGGNPDLDRSDRNNPAVPVPEA